MKYSIALLKGDGIGPEIVDSAVEVLKKVGTKFGHEFEFTPYLIGGCAIDATGERSSRCCRRPEMGRTSG